MALDTAAGAAIIDEVPSIEEHVKAVRRLEPLRATSAPGFALQGLNDVVYVRDRHGLQRVERAAIRLVQADGNYVEIHTMDRRFVVGSPGTELEFAL